MKKKLSLKKQTIANLNQDELSSVKGASMEGCNVTGVITCKCGTIANQTCVGLCDTEMDTTCFLPTVVGCHTKWPICR